MIGKHLLKTLAAVLFILESSEREVSVALLWLGWFTGVNVEQRVAGRTEGQIWVKSEATCKGLLLQLVGVRKTSQLLQL